MKEKNLNNFSGDGETSYTVFIEKSSLKNIQSFFKLDKYNLLNSSVEINGSTLKENKILDTKFSVNQNDVTEIVQSDKKIAISMPSLYKKYILLDTNTAKSDVNKLFDLSQDENSSKVIKKIKNKYLKLIAKEIKENVTLKNDEKIDLNSNEYKTIRYELNLENKQIMSVLETLENELKDDEEVISFITNKINDFNKLESGYTKNKSDFSELKKEDIKNQILNLSKNLENSLEINIKLYEYENQNIKTEIKVKTNKDSFYILLESEPNNQNDKINILLKRNENEISLNYTGTLEKDSYSGKLKFNNKSDIFKINLIKLKKPTRSVRKIDNLTYTEISKLSDDEIAKIREKIKNKLNSNSQSKDNNRRFEIETPETKQDEIENSKLAYKRVNPVTIKEELIMILGEPSKTKSGENEKEEYIYWTQGDGKELISAKIHGVKVYEIINDTAQNKELNLEIYKNISGDLEDVKVLENSIKSGDSYENVVKILGEKNIECLKSYLGEKEYIWYDKKGESLKIKFDKDRKVIK